MEKRQLDLNAPLLSARRHSSPSKSPQIPKSKVMMEKRIPSRQQSLPSNRLDSESEAVTRPGCVPFHWEHSPGRRKDAAESSSTAQTPEPLITPRLPPGKISDAFRRYSGEVPRLPPATITRFSSGERMYDQNQNIYRPQIEAFSFNDHASLLESLSESLKCKDETDSERECDVYSDALDILTPEESGSMKCSASGISVCNSSDVKTSDTFCIDTDTKDFMMSRFLRAAKGVVKKPPVVDEHPKPMKKYVSGPIEPSLKPNGSVTSSPMERHSLNSLPFYNQSRGGAEIQEYQEPRGTVKKPGKFSWGIFGRSCVKNALWLLNPLPGMKLKSRTPSTPPTLDGSRFARKTQSGPLDRSGLPIPPPPKKKFFSGLLSGHMLATENRYDPNQFLHHRDPYRSGVSPMRRYRSGNVSPYRNEIPKSPFHEGALFLGVPKQVRDSTANKIASSRKLFKALQDVSRNPTYERGSAPTGDIVEKTVYIDKSSYRRSGPAHVEDGDMVRFDQKLPCLIASDGGGKPNPKFSFTNQDQDTTYALHVTPYPSLDSRTSSECIKQVSDVEHEDGKLESASIMEYDPFMKSPPPLPKSPSESWLGRTLPSINVGNPFAHSRQRGHLQSKNQPHRVTASDAKWETIVKTSNMNRHGPYSQEMIPHSSHRQRKSLLH